MARVASLDFINIERAAQQIVRSSFENWKNQFPLVIVCKLESIQNEVLLAANSLLWFRRLNGSGLEQGTRRHSSTWQILLHFVLSTLMPYISNRLLSLSNNNSRKFIHKLIAICRLANLIQLLLFYCKGGYPNLAETITRPKRITKSSLGITFEICFRSKLNQFSFIETLILQQLFFLRKFLICT